MNMLWLIPVYLLVGAIGGAGVSFIFQGKCPTWGELLSSSGIGALFWVPILGLMAIAMPFVGVQLACEKISETAWWARFKKWLRRPICQRKSI